MGQDDWSQFIDQEADSRRDGMIEVTDHISAEQDNNPGPLGSWRDLSSQ